MADIFNLTDTWNAGGTTFTAIKMDVTDTASAAGSLLMDLLVGGVSKFSVSKTGVITTGTLSLGMLGTNPRLFGSADDLLLGVSTAHSLAFYTGNLQRWQINSSGHLVAGAVDTYNFGSATNKAADVFGTRYLAPMKSELTIATGAVTSVGSYHRVDTEADAASDDLDTINGGADGAILILRAENAARTVVVKDGTGNIQCAGDMSLDNTQDSITLIYDGTLTAWLELSRSDNGA